MGTKKISKAIFLILLIILSSCNKKQNSLEKVFTLDEIKEIDLIIDFYDNHVQSLTDKTIPIEEAYTLFIDYNRPTSSNDGNEELFYINSKDRNEFLKTIDLNLLLEIYKKHDSTVIINPKSKERFIIYPPFHFTSLNPNGKFIEFLSGLAKRDTFYKDIADEIKNMGDVSPTIIAQLLYENSEINFSKREERFVFIVCFLEF